MYLFINNVDKTENLINNTIRINSELQERIDSASFSIAWINPSYYDDVKIYEWFPIVSSTVNSVTLKKDYFVAWQNNLFRVWDTVDVALGLGDQEIWTIASLLNNNWQLQLTFVNNFTNQPVSWELAGIKKFAGNIIDIKDRNKDILENIEFWIKCVDYTRVFDKSLVNDTYEDKDARYIVNDFCNVTINRNQTIDQFEYTTDAQLRAAWIEWWDWWNPTIDTSDLRESISSAVFDWINSWWTASFTNNFTSVNIEDFTWVPSWTPTAWVFALWYKADDFNQITNVEARIWSDSSNYWSFTFTPTDNEWVFEEKEMSELSITWTPDWTDCSYVAIIVTETWDSNIKIDWIRILEIDHFKHYPYVQESTSFNDFRVPRLKPTQVMQRLADNLAWYWYIDYDKNIRLFPESTNFAPVSFTETSNNFKDLQIQFDPSRLVNRQVIKWWNETSEDKYSQVVEWDSVIREWILKNKFKNLVVKLDDWSVTDTMESWTTTTLVNATDHWLSVWDYIVNRTRSNAVRAVLTVPDVDSFTVEAVTSQTNWDTFSTFVEQDVWIEWINEESAYNFMSNFNEKSIRNAEQETTLVAWEFLLFNYNEVFPILVQRTDNVSVANLKSILWYSDWIFDWQPIIDRTINSRSEAIQVAEAVLTKYSNVIITAKVKTNQEWLRSGQLIRIKDTDSSLRNIDQDFIIQSVKSRQIAWWENEYTLTCSSLLFWMLELLQQLLAQQRKIEIDEDEIINNIEDAFETLTITDVETDTVWGEIQTETVTIWDSEVTEVITPPFKWATWTAPELKWNLWSWS